MGTGTLRLIRRGEFADRLRSYRILINGAKAGTIGPNAVLDLKVPTGQLRIEARIDWCRSLPLTIEVAPNQRIEIEVSNHWGILLSIWAITLGFRSYLTLKHLRMSPIATLD